MKHAEVFDHFSEHYGIPASEWTQIEPLLVKKKFKKGGFFLKADERVQNFGIVTKGMLRLYYQDKKGKEYTKAFRAPIDIVCAYAEWLMDVPSKTFIVANEDSEMIVGKLDDLKKLYKSNRHFEKLGRIVAEQMYIEKAKREFDFLQLSAESRYENFMKEFSKLTNDIPQFQIASYLGITPVALSRLRGRRKKK